MASSIGPALSEYNGKLYAMWKGSGNDQKLWYASFDGSNWSSQSRVPGDTGQDEMAPVPSGGLRSDYNYVFNSNCNPIKNLSVTIEITQDLVGSTGFSIQLNAYSQLNKKCAWQQYGFDINPGPSGSISYWVDNWPVSGDNLMSFGLGVNDPEILLALPNGVLPVGYKLEISLGSDADGNITSATYVIIDNHEMIKKEQPLILESIQLADGSGLVTSADLAPIVAFELNIVRTPFANYTDLSGKGTITYVASSPLTALSQPPECVETRSITAETSNCIYGLLPQKASNTFVQSFCANP